MRVYLLSEQRKDCYIVLKIFDMDLYNYMTSAISIKQVNSPFCCMWTKVVRK